MLTGIYYTTPYGKLLRDSELPASFENKSYTSWSTNKNYASGYVSKYTKKRNSEKCCLLRLKLSIDTPVLPVEKVLDDPGYPDAEDEYEVILPPGKLNITGREIGEYKGQFCITTIIDVELN